MSRPKPNLKDIDIQTRTRLIVAAATLAVASIASAQYRVDNGNARDANTRLGSGGYNGGGGTGNNYAVSSNNVATGNVTGGRGFRGGATPDRFSFRGNVAGGGVDNFIARSSGVPVYQGGQNVNNNAQNVRPFYGTAETAQAPNQFQFTNSQLGYTPAPAAARSGSDLRLGVPVGGPTYASPVAGQLMLPGPVTNSTDNSLITASPLYGVRQWNPTNQGDADFLNGTINDKLGGGLVNNAAISQGRGELMMPDDGKPDNQAAPANGNDANAPTDGNATPGDASSLNKPIGQPLGKPAGTPDNGTVGAPAIPLATPIGGSTGTNQVTRSKLLMPASLQSAQLQQLQTRLEQQRKIQGLSPEQAAVQEFNETKALKDKLEKEAAAKNGGATPGGPAAPGATPGGTTPGANPAGPGATPKVPGGPSVPAPTARDAGGNVVVPSPSRGRVEKPKPMQIDSLATGVKAKGLADTLAEAERLMKDGKFAGAIRQYGIAKSMAPNQPLATIGQANAELGATYYGLAGTHVREAFTADNSLMLAQYNLRSMLGDERVDLVAAELKKMADKDQKDPKPLFLLAYVAYNTGNERLAASWLDYADKRSGGNDPFYKLVKDHWSLPDTGELNK